MTQTKNTVQAMTYAVALGLAVVAISFISAPAFASAASYAYVDATGEVKSVVANDWMTAIATAPNIHIHSGVFVLKTAADFAVIGKDIKGAQ